MAGLKHHPNLSEKLSDWTGMTIQTMLEPMSLKQLIKISANINGHISSVQTAFDEYQYDEMLEYIGTVRNAFNQIRKLTAK